MAAKKRVALPKLSPKAYTTEADERALKALEKVPLLPAVLKKFYELGLDRWLYCTNMAMSVRCGPKQFPTLYEIFKESCHILDVPEPELYVTSNPFPNAMTGGVERPFITIRSSIIDTLSDEQLFHLIGHELGHIKSGHLLYHSVGRMLIPLLQAIGRRLPIIGDVAAIGLVFAFYEWIRQSEISCDRAGLLVTQNFETSMYANLAITAGPNRLSHETNLDAFLDQARAYQEAQPLDQIGKVLLYFFYTWSFTHPMSVHRAQQLEKWYRRGEFDKIIHGNYERIQ